VRPRFFDLVLFLLLATALAFAAAPLFAFRALKSAATYEDVAAIGELVDFHATRRALTQQLEARATPAPATAEPPSLWRNPMGVFRPPHPTMVYWDPHRARIAVPRPEAKDKRTVFTWQRRDKWFEWKLVAVTLPVGEP